MELDLIIVLEGEIEDDEIVSYCTAMHGWVAEAFDLSQEYVPVRTGRLKASGRVEGGEEWRTIIYAMDYAESVEWGVGEPGEKGYFPGRFYLSRAVDETEDMFEIFLKFALHDEFDVIEEP